MSFNKVQQSRQSLVFKNVRREIDYFGEFLLSPKLGRIPNPVRVFQFPTDFRKTCFVHGIAASKRLLQDY
jgi:hypothetical protein